MVKLGLAGGVMLHCGLLLVAASSRRRRRRRTGIRFPGLFLAPMTSYSGVNGEAVEYCIGVRGRHLFISSRWCGCCPFSSQMRRWLWVLRMEAGWIWLDLPSATQVVDGVPGSRSWKSWGVALVDGRPATAPSRLQGRVSTSTPLKANRRWSSSSSWWRTVSSSAVEAGDDDSGRGRSTLDLRTLLWFLFSLGSLV
jgi:hypothetical protein